MSPPASPSPPSPPTQSSDLLVAKLASVLPQGHEFGVYHISTPPSRCEALFHAPPGAETDRTFCESHFLAVTIGTDNEGEVLVFALEIFIYTTAFASTFFVSKADSSGYLHLLGLPRGAPSPIRAVSSAFVAYLVEQRRRPGIAPVVNLFARAQSQYLFPGSVDNKGKHVLDDRGLVKWWCRVLDELVVGEGGDTTSNKGYLVVPGLDQYEMRAFLPKRNPAPGRWTLGHPLEEISHYVAESRAKAKKDKDNKDEKNNIPPRCLIPRYPDDPKARYLDELDDEAERAGQAHKSHGDGKAKGPNFGNGMWTSIKTLDQFWDMMAYRQECSSGRLTGFIWVVFGASDSGGGGDGGSEPDLPETDDDDDEQDDGVTPLLDRAAADKKPRKIGKPMRKTKIKPRRKVRPKKAKKLHGRITPRKPRTKTTQQHHYLTKRPTTTRYYHWPVEGRGRLLVDPVDYKRINELLLQLDFSTLAKSGISTRRWVQEAGVGSDWRLAVQGAADYTATVPAVVAGSEEGGSKKGPNDLSGLVKRKRTVSSAVETETAATEGTAVTANVVNVLSTGLVRKKPKQ